MQLKYLALLQAVAKREQVAIVQCPGHQKLESCVAQGNQEADKAAETAAKGDSCLGALLPQ